MTSSWTVATMTIIFVLAAPDALVRTMPVAMNRVRRENANSAPAANPVRNLLPIRFWNNLQFDTIKQLGWRHDLDRRIGKPRFVARDNNISAPLLHTRNLDGILKIGMFLSKVSLYALSLQGHKTNYRNRLLHKQLCMLAFHGSTKNINCNLRGFPYSHVHHQG